MNILERILRVYEENILAENRTNMWDWCQSHNSKVELNESNLENMANTDLVFGFFGGSHEMGLPESNTNAAIERVTRTALLKLAQLIGVSGIENPEGGLFLTQHILKLSDSDMLRKIETSIGFKIELPEFVGGREVVKTDFGIITDRHIHYLYILKRIIDLCPDRNSSIIEIGGGLGLLPYFLDKAGYKDYTCIDLAHANVCQAYFLHKNLPERELIISREKKNPFSLKYKNAIKLLHTSDFPNMPDYYNHEVFRNKYDSVNILEKRFDIMINIDGFTEMSPSEVFKYIRSNCPLLLSINHEVNEYRVIDLCEKYRKLIYRYPFWIRPGYVEELYTLK